MPKVSIIIPVYNVEQFLDKCINSAKEQTLQDIEIILIDDESPDGSPQMCDEYAKKDYRIKVVHKKNGGLGFARNNGLELATGEYVTFLDSDDFVDMSTYEHLYNLVTKYDLDVVYYKFKRFVNEEDILSEKINNDITEYSGKDVKELMLDIIASEPSAKMDHKIACSSCTALYRLSIIRENNVKFHSERELISEDLIFNLDYLKYAQKIAFNDSVHYYYRMNPMSLTSTVRTDRMDKNIELYEYIKKNLLNWELDIQKGLERNQRLFIGYSRSAIKLLLKSSYNKKTEWLDNVLAKSIWNDLYLSFEWRRLPCYQRLFFIMCYKKCKLGLRLLSFI